MRIATRSRRPIPAAISRSSLAQQVTDNLRQRIYDRKLRPGVKLDEAELARQLGVSRTPVREALRLLAAQGLVEMRSRRGCVVASLTVEDQKEIFPIMARLEGWVAHEAAERRTAAEMAHIEALHAELERHAAAGDVDRYWEANYVVHVALQELVGNGWLQNILGELRRKLNLARHRSLKLPGRIHGSLAEHRALLQALRDGDGRRAEAVMQEHLHHQLDALLELEGAAPEPPSPLHRSPPQRAAPPTKPQ